MYIILIFINFFSITLQSVKAGIFCDDYLREIYLIDEETKAEKIIAQGSDGTWSKPYKFEELDADPGSLIKFRCYNDQGYAFGAGCFLINDKCYCHMFNNTEIKEFSKNKPYPGEVIFENNKKCNIEIKYLKGADKQKNYYYQQYIPLDADQIECIENKLIIVPNNMEYSLNFSDFIKSPFKLTNLKINIEENYQYFTLNKAKLSPDTKFKIINNLTFFHDGHEHSKIKINFKYYGVLSEEDSKKCELIIRVCYDSCLECNDKDPDNDNHQCKTCKNDYFFIEGTNNCMTKKQMENTSYYFDKDNNTFKKCYSDCLHCKEKGDSSNMKCKDCNPQKYYAEPSNCIDDITSYYYSEEKKKYLKCYKTCQTCNGNNNRNSHNCITCIDDYHFIYNEPGKCISSDEKPLNTYLDTENNTYRQCSDRCHTCDNAENCTECYKDESNKYIYHFIENEKGKCISENELDTLSYLDINENTYKLCPKGTIAVENNKCISRSAIYLVFFIISIIILIALFIILIWRLIKKKNTFNINEESKDMISLI